MAKRKVSRRKAPRRRVSRRSAKRHSRRGALRGLAGVTKQDFVAIAGAFCTHGASRALVDDVASYFKGQNPRFDKARFEAASLCETGVKSRRR